MRYYSNDMLWKNIFDVIFLTCNFSFSAVTCNDYRCSFGKINTQPFLLQNIPCLHEENSYLNYLGVSLEMLTLSINQYQPFLVTTKVGNPPHLLPMKHDSGTQGWRPDRGRDTFVKREADESLYFPQLGIHANEVAWTLKCI